MKFKKTTLALGITTAALSIALVSPQAMAHKAATKHHHAHAQQSRSQVDVLEAQVRAMQDQISTLTAQQNSNMAAAAPIVSGVAADSAKVAELDQWMASVKAAPVIEKTKDNMMFFRGGYGHANSTRGGTLDPTYVPGVGANKNGVAVGSLADKDAWYMGAGFDFSLNNNLFGLMDNTEVLAELMFDYKELGRRGQNGLSAQEVGVVNTLQGGKGVINVNGTLTPAQTLAYANTAGTVSGVANGVVVRPAAIAATSGTQTNTATYVDTQKQVVSVSGQTFNLPAANTKTATVNQFTLAASPKIKFLKGSAFRPWIIPVGFEINVVSPPSNAITVLSPGMQFGIGADYKIWKDLYVGADARYHQQLGSIDGVNTNGVTAGGYLGLGF